jgi:mercuric ion binding protein
MKRTILAVSTWLALSGAAMAEDIQYNLRVDGLTCPFCVATSERELRQIEGVTAVSTDLRTGVISVCASDAVAFTDEQLRRLFLAKGFTYRSMTRQDGCAIAS